MKILNLYHIFFQFLHSSKTKNQTKPTSLRCSKNNYHKLRNRKNRKIRKVKYPHSWHFKNHRKMNNSIKLITWVYSLYLYHRPHAAPKNNKNNPATTVSILNDLIRHPCQIIMTKINRSRLPKNKKENSKKDREKHLHTT